MIAVLCPTCGGDTLWRYPHLERARLGSPHLPPRSYATVEKCGHTHAYHSHGYRLCPDPTAHVESFRESQKEKIQ